MAGEGISAERVKLVMTIAQLNAVYAECDITDSTHHFITLDMLSAIYDGHDKLYETLLTCAVEKYNATVEESKKLTMPEKFPTFDLFEGHVSKKRDFDSDGLLNKLVNVAAICAATPEYTQFIEPTLEYIGTLHPMSPAGGGGSGGPGVDTTSTLAMPTG
jgi:hypothetical protein